MGLAKERSEGPAIPRSPMGGAGQWDIAAGETLDLLVKRFVVVPTLRNFSQRAGLVTSAAAAAAVTPSFTWRVVAATTSAFA